ncbi:GRB2-related adapter protein 2b [Aplochiton taeniatus]
MEATAKFDFTATADDELCFRKGEPMTIIGTTDNWFKAELNGEQGFVPRNYIDLDLPSWYQESSSRGDAQERLMTQPLGSFLIRGSQSSPGDFSISVRHERDVQHFKVMKDSRWQYYLWSVTFASLNKLVDFYKANSVSKISHICLLDCQQKLPSVGRVRALYDFGAEDKDELDFRAGDVIEVLERPDASWWRGSLGGQTGLFPSNYTAPV